MVPTGVLHGIQVTVVVPAYDEAPRIRRVLLDIPRDVDQVLVVDDGSRDGTREAALEVARSDPRVEVLSHPTNRGVGAAIVTGYSRARALAGEGRAAFVVMAGDGQMAPEDLPSVVEPIARGQADYVKGCRFGWRGTSARMPVARRIGGWGFSVLTSIAIGQRVRDSQCGYTALASTAARELDLDDLWPGYGYPNDLLGHLALRGLRITEVPVRPVYADEVSRLRLRHLPTISWIVARAWARRITA